MGETLAMELQFNKSAESSSSAEFEFDAEKAQVGLFKAECFCALIISAYLQPRYADI